MKNKMKKLIVAFFMAGLLPFVAPLALPLMTVSAIVVAPAVNAENWTVASACVTKVGGAYRDLFWRQNLQNNCDLGVKVVYKTYGGRNSDGTIPRANSTIGYTFLDGKETGWVSLLGDAPSRGGRPQELHISCVQYKDGSTGYC